MTAENRIIAGRYRLLDVVGEGGMGTVVRARDERAKRDVAVKLVRPELLGERALARFEREGRLAASVRHPNVVEVLDSGVTDDGRPYLVMELLQGDALDQRLEVLPPPRVDEVVGWIADALDGLGAVHAAGIVHRDLKPGNLFLAREGRGITVKVLDFGLSRSVAPSIDGAPVASLTQTHQFLGTPYYVSPEQVRSAKRIDARADLFSMGVILWEALVGHRPFDGPNAAAIIAAVVADEPPSLSETRPDLPLPLAVAVARALARDPADRFQDAAEMASALRSAARGVGEVLATPRRLSPVSPVAATEPTGSAPPVLPRSTTAGGTGVRPTKLRLPMILLALIALAAVGGGVVIALRAMGVTPSAPPAPEVRVASPAEVDPRPARARSLGGPGPGAPIVARLRALPRDVRHALRVHEQDGGFVLSTRAEADADEVARAAALLGAEVGPALEGPGLRARVLQTTQSLNLRRERGVDGEFVRTLPRGTLLVGLEGVVEGELSEAGGRGTWSWVAPSESASGWSAGRYLEPYEGCVPDLPSLLDDVPDGRGAAVLSDALVSRLRLRTQEGVVGTTVLLARDVERGRSHLLLFDTEPDCTVELRRALMIPGRVVDLLTPTTHEAGGVSLLIVAWHQGDQEAPPGGMETWSAYLPGRRPPVWEVRLETSQQLAQNRRAVLKPGATRGPAGDPGYWPVFIRYQDGRREWFRYSEAKHTLEVDLSDHR